MSTTASFEREIKLRFASADEARAAIDHLAVVPVVVSALLPPVVELRAQGGELRRRHRVVGDDGAVAVEGGDKVG